jgi:superfamily II DNA or RNA helicase
MSIVSTFPNGLWPLQVAGALRMCEQRRLVVADHPGAGKTAQVMFAWQLDGLLERPSAILVTAPKTACQLTWALEVERRITSQYAVVVADLTGALGRKRKTPPSVAERNDYLAQKIAEAARLELPLIVIVNFDGLRWPPTGPPKMTNLWSVVYDAIVIDEAHLVLPTKEDDITKMTQFWRGLTQVQGVPNGLRLSMTGTPDRGKFENRYGHWKFLMREQYRNYRNWERHNLRTWFDDDGNWHVGGPLNEALWTAFERQHMLRRTKAEMHAGLPEKQWAGDGGAILLPITPAMVEQQEAFAAELEAKIAAEELDPDAARLAAYVHGRQMSICTWDRYDNRPWRARRAGTDASPVLGWIEDFLEARGHHEKNLNPDLGKVIITSYFTEVLAWLKDELKALGFGDVPILSGDTPLHEKLAIEERFQRGDLRLLLFSGHIGTSINLDAADDMVFTDVVHDPDKMEQTEDRIHRASRIHQVTYWRLIVEDTMMGDVLAQADQRYQALRKSYDGTRGVAYLRKMLGDFERLAA